MNKTTLNDRIASILTTPSSAATISETLAEAVAALDADRVRLAEAEAVAIDPLADGRAVAAAESSLSKIGLGIRRLEAAIAKLRERETEARTVEREASRADRYEAAEAERDAVAEAIRAEYPKALAILLPLGRRIVSSNAELNHVNRTRPDGKPMLARAETVARGHKPGSTGHPSIVEGMTLPSLENAYWPVWPPRDENGYVTFA